MEKTIKRIKWIYSGELLVIAAVFLTFGLLELLHVMNISDRMQLIFKIITLVGATWIVTDFVWLMLSPKRQKKNCKMDKIMVLPSAAYLYVFDILGFVQERPYEYYQIGIPLLFFYLACVYSFQGIYHYYHPIPMVQEMIDEAIKEEQEKEAGEASKDIIPEGGFDNDTTLGETNEDSSNEQ